METWKDIKGYEGLYQISNYGNAKSLDRHVAYSNGLNAIHKGRLLKVDKSKLNTRGKYYFRVTLSKNDKQKRFSVHQLVAQYFIKKGNHKKCVNHIDGNPENNNVKNLEWCSYSENEKHSYDVLKKVNPIRKLTDQQARYIRDNAVKSDNRKQKGNIQQLCKKYGITKNVIYNIMKNTSYVSS
jgi:hypothetical protein